VVLFPRLTLSSYATIPTLTTEPPSTDPYAVVVWEEPSREGRPYLDYQVPNYMRSRIGKLFLFLLVGIVSVTPMSAYCGDDPSLRLLQGVPFVVDGSQTEKLPKKLPIELFDKIQYVRTLGEVLKILGPAYRRYGDSVGIAYWYFDNDRILSILPGTTGTSLSDEVFLEAPSAYNGDPSNPYLYDFKLKRQKDIDNKSRDTESGPAGEIGALKYGPGS
jgi:hypothetical protein